MTSFVTVWREPNTRRVSLACNPDKSPILRTEAETQAFGLRVATTEDELRALLREQHTAAATIELVNATLGWSL